jgi:hypothetical protein
MIGTTDLKWEWEKIRMGWNRHFECECAAADDPDKYEYEHSIKFQYNDGGREAAGYKGKNRDCVCRSIAIAAQIPYQQVYDELNEFCSRERWRTKKSGKKVKSSSRTGVKRTTIKKYLTQLGWVFVPLMGIGTGCKVHLRNGELPMGRIIVSLSGHYAAVIDGVLNDTNYDVCRDGTRCVYGYWTREGAAA